MPTSLSKFNLYVLFVSFLAFLPLQAQADILKWVRKEALPTITGKRPVEIKPYVSIKSGSTSIKLGQDEAMIKVGNVTVQTGKLKYRLAQAGCLYATGGDVMTCIPDIIDREANKLFSQVAKGIEPNSDLPPPLKPKAPPGSTVPVRDGPLKFEDLDARVIEWEPMKASVGTDFSKTGTASNTPQSPSAFLHTIAIARGVDSKNRATVGIVGRADFAFMTGRKGGILCLFASEKGKYLKDRNEQYSDPYGLVALGGTVTVTSSPDLVPIQLTIPWSELELPDDENPYDPKFVQCHITVDNKVESSTDWIPF